MIIINNKQPTTIISKITTATETFTHLSTILSNIVHVISVLITVQPHSESSGVTRKNWFWFWAILHNTPI